MIISVGYRVKSAQGTRLRQWATRVLRGHLVHGYPPGKQEKATQTVLEQAELLSGDWAVA